MSKKQLEKEIREIFAVLQSGNSAEVKKAKKDLRELWYQNPQDFQKLSLLFKQLLRELQGHSDPRKRADMISGLNLFFLAMVRKEFDTVTEFILYNITDTDGRVREAVRHISAWMLVEAYNDEPGPKSVTKEGENISKLNDKYQNFLNRLEQLIEKYAPDKIPVHIEDNPPSIYKSLVLLWHQVTPPDLKQKKLGELSVQYRKFIPYKDEKHSLEEVDPDEVREGIWNTIGQGDPKKGREQLMRLEKWSAERLKSKLKQDGFSNSDAEGVIATLRVYGSHSIPAILHDLLTKGKEQQTIVDLTEAADLGRCLQSYGNHALSSNNFGPVSLLLKEALVERECRLSGKPDDLNFFIELINDTHNSLDEFWSRYRAETEEFISTLRDLNQKPDNTPEEAQQEEVRLDERYDLLLKQCRLAESVSHHALDWYIQADPVSFNRTGDPYKMAAYILALVRDINFKTLDDDDIISVNYDNNTLSAFGGWKSSNNFSGVWYRIGEPIWDVVGDPDLLFIEPEKLKKNHPRLSEWWPGNIR